MTGVNQRKAPFPWFADGTIVIGVLGEVLRCASRGRTHGPRRIDLPDRSKGYRNVRLPIGGSWRTFKAHRLVWMWHHGDIPDGYQINHINGKKDDNRIGNLELVTASGNIRHSYDELGRPRPWSKATTWRDRPKLTPQQMDEIRAARADGALLREIAADWQISTTHIHRIVGGREEVGG